MQQWQCYNWRIIIGSKNVFNNLTNCYFRRKNCQNIQRNIFNLSMYMQFQSSFEYIQQRHLWGVRDIHGYPCDFNISGSGDTFHQIRRHTLTFYLITEQVYNQLDILSLMIYTKFGCHPPSGSLIISRIKLIMDQVSQIEVR